MRNFVHSTRREFLAAVAGTAAAAAAPVPRPNVVFLLLDDLGWKDFGCYGNTFHETPNLDRLARQSVRFTNAYAACPVCSPTRAALMTGKYPARLHLTDWIPGRKQWPTAKLLTPQFEQQLPLAETTIAEALKPLGYRTASVGKWHLGGQGFWPDNQGFDLNVGGNHRGSPASYFGPFDLPNLKGGAKDDYLTEKLTEAAEKFIEESAAKETPFFLYLPEYTVHIPLQAREAAVEKYRKKNGGKDFPNPVYAAMVESFDQAVRRIRAQLDQLNLTGNTILFVTSDNGGLRYEGRSKNPVTDNSPLRAGKGHLFEGGIREPLLVWWPGHAPAGRVNERSVFTTVDLLPTLCAIAGAGIPAEVKGKLDGEDLSAALTGGSPVRRQPVFWEYGRNTNAFAYPKETRNRSPNLAVRQGDWKLLINSDGSGAELYDLAADPNEENNVAAKEAAVARRLSEEALAWRRELP